LKSVHLIEVEAYVKAALRLLATSVAENHRCFWMLHSNQT